MLGETLKDLWDVVFSVFISLAIICTFIVTVKLSLKFNPEEIKLSYLKNPIINFATSWKWCFSLIILIPSYIGRFERMESSIFPWVEFMDAYHRFGLFDGIFGFLSVIIVDLWLFWTAANAWIGFNPTTDNTKKNIIRVVNILAGLWLSDIKPSSIFSALDKVG